MSDLRRNAVRGLLVVGGVAVGSATAFGLPWNVDMADTQAVRAYEQVMQPLPEGVVSQAHLLTPRSFRPSYTLQEAQGLQNPLPSNEETLALGERMYGVYCTPCHGDGTQVGPVGEPGRFPGVAMLAGENGVAANRTDGHLYAYIRNGGALMPAYGRAMDETEMWAIVSFVRTLPNAARAPQPPPEPANPENPQ